LADVVDVATATAARSLALSGSSDPRRSANPTLASANFTGSSGFGTGGGGTGGTSGLSGSVRRTVDVPTRKAGEGYVDCPFPS
jgi:hypothetical protein